MNGDVPAYGLWLLALVNSAVFILFAFSFTKPKSRRDWRSLGVFSAFIVALFTEMYGFPLTIYLLSGWLSQLYPNVDLFTHESGHLLSTLLGFDGNPHFNGLHILSNLLIVAGFVLIAAAWRVLYEAQRQNRLADTGVYARIRHPQYVGFVVIMFGFLLQWPTILTLAMFPVMSWVYYRLAKREERDVLERFGADYAQYAKRVPGFFPRIDFTGEAKA